MATQECKGSAFVVALRSKRQRVQARHMGHQLMKTGPWVWCLRCGKHSLKKVVGLNASCNGRLHGQYRVFHGRLRAGAHPYSGAEVAAAKPLLAEDWEELAIN
eukprot:2929888-Karenia_brevis.AAC.1